MKLRWLAWTTSAIGLTLLNDCGGFGMDCSFGVGWSPKVCKFALHHSSSTQEHQEIRTENDMNVKTSDVLSLDSIRSTLIRQEETIIFALIERAAFRSNCIVYEKSNQANSFGRLGIPDGAVVTQENKGEVEQLTFMEYMLLSTEILHNKVRRYTSPEEHAFFPQFLPAFPMPNLPQLEYPPLLSNDGGASDINFNNVLLRRYISDIIPAITQQGDDEQHGSSVVCDVNLLQALSRRIHYGKFVAESKYRSNPKEYERLVSENNHEGVMALLTNMAVEQKLLRRVRLKAANYGREPMDIPIPLDGLDTEQEKSAYVKKAEERQIVAVAAATAVMAALESWDHQQGEIRQGSKVDPLVIEAIYRDLIIPLTKDIEVAYLFKRCGKEPPPQYRGL